jgi:long-chain acyl-CoA synthetase
MSGYYKDPERRPLCLTRRVFHTGVYGKLDEEGWLYITGRSKT